MSFEEKLLNKPKLLVLLGPTASGKSNLALSIAKSIENSVIINADSLQVYKYFDIGTAKPSIKEQNQIPHYLIDIINPDQDYNAGLFRKDTLKLIDTFFKEEKKIVLVGGTFLYIKSLLYGLIDNVEINYDIRKQIDEERNKYGLEYLYNNLCAVDRKAAERIHPNDYVRIQRALEVYYDTGVTISELQKNHQFKENHFNVLKIGLQVDREKLKTNIEKRVENMFDSGLVEEVIKLRELGYGSHLKPMKSIGYKEVNLYLDKKLSINEAKELIIRDTKRFAKRQLTWLKKEENVLWQNPTQKYKKIIKLSKDFLQDN